MDPDLSEALKAAAEEYRNMTADERAAMLQAQRESWVRATSTGCEHGVLDFETCPQCREPRDVTPKPL